METMTQPKIAGYRQLSEQEVELMNEAKELAEKVGEFVRKLQRLPSKDSYAGVPRLVEIEPGKVEPMIDKRWVAIGATDLQKGFMAVIRGIAQPTTF